MTDDIDWRCSHGAPAHANCFDCMMGDPIEAVAPIVHFSTWSQQPDVWLTCGRWTIPSRSQPDGLQAGMYQEDGGELYTFEHASLVTCQECLDRVARGDVEPR